MATDHSYDVIVVGGGLAGSALAGVLARSGLAILVVEKEARFRDRIRAETTCPWGVAEAHRTGIGHLYELAGGVEITAFQKYEQQLMTLAVSMTETSIDGLPMIGFSHPGLQEVALTWAASQGATILRPAKAIGIANAGGPSVNVISDGRETSYPARLIVGADGKNSAARGWFGARTVADPEDHKFGGVLVSGVRTDDRHGDNFGDWKPDGGAAVDVRVNWFATGADSTRLYLMGAADRLRALGVDRSIEALIALAASVLPEGALESITVQGPIGFFGNQDIWSSQVVGDGVVLIGDAAGAPDPTQGHGTSLVWRDVRELSELLLADDDWPAALAEFAVRRQRYFEVIREYDRWTCFRIFGQGETADRAREGNLRARQADPTLRGFATMETRGPDGLVADEAMRQLFFGGAIV